MQHFDIIVIGTGAGGATLAHRIAPSGKKILILERGQWLPREEQNWDPREVFTQGRYRTTETWQDAHTGEAFEPFTHYWVGGNTKLYGAALFRLRESDFGQVRHFGGISPAWPLSYTDFAPYYDEAEHLYSVHGQRGLDPCEPPTRGPYPHRPLAHEPRIAKLAADLHAQGIRAFPMPLGLRMETEGSEAPIRLSKFDGYPDPMQVKADAQVVCVEPTLRHSNVTLLAGRHVERLETDPSGRHVKTVVARHEGHEERFEADLVVVACGAVNSAALLLRSKSAAHPGGLANAHDLVGRHYMTHINGAVIAISDERNDAAFQKTFAITDFYHGAPDSPHPLGTIQLMGKTDPDGLAGLVEDAFPGRDIEDISHYSIDFWLTAEDLPDPDNRIDLDPDGGIRVHYRANNLEAYDRLRDKLKALLEGCGCSHVASRDNVYVGYTLSVSGVSHQNGTLRFGTDPRTSVLDTHCKAHGLDNLYVVDASFFPSCGAINPSLTIMANALRVGDVILDRLR